MFVSFTSIYRKVSLLVNRFFEKIDKILFRDYQKKDDDEYSIEFEKKMITYYLGITRVREYPFKVEVSVDGNMVKNFIIFQCNIAFGCRIMTNYFPRNYPLFFFLV